MTGTLGLYSEAWRRVPSDSRVLIFASTHLLARPVGHGSGIIIMDFPMDATKLQETIEQALKQAMINWSDSLADMAINTLHSVVRGGYQYYALAPQPMACQQVYMGSCYQQPEYSGNAAGWTGSQAKVQYYEQTSVRQPIIFSTAVFVQLLFTSIG